MKPDEARRYLASKFGDDLAAAKSAMETLAKALPPKQLATKAFHLYEQFRPEIPDGVEGWGAQGVLVSAGAQNRPGMGA